MSRSLYINPLEYYAANKNNNYDNYIKDGNSKIKKVLC